MVIIPTTNDPCYDLTCNLGVCLEYSSGSAAPIRDGVSHKVGSLRRRSFPLR